jgi:DNA replication protein DnaC
MRVAGKRLMWLKAPDMADKWRQFVGNYDHEVQQEARAFREQLDKADCVFIDDLGEERVPLDSKGKPRSDLFNEQFKLLVERAKSLVVTTNFDSKMLFDRYGEKIMDRIFQNAVAVRMEGENYRRKSFPRLK